MAFGTGASSARGGSPGFRFAIYAILSIVIMTLDQKGEPILRKTVAKEIPASAIALQERLNARLPTRNMRLRLGACRGHHRAAR